MSSVDDNYDDDDFSEDEGGNTPRDLRRQLSKLKKQLQEEQAARAELQKQARTSTIAEVLREKQANPKLAKYISRDLEGDVTAEAVSAWLEEEGELFGYTPADAADSEVDENVAAQQQAISAATSAAGPVTRNLDITAIKSMTPKQLIEAGILQPK